jgi:transcription initiation factor TFIIIB Brf1 subunit/transcription initiation factor TFIIB
MTDLDAELTDENAQKVLARALELQAQSARALTVAQIREIASELSIPESAVDQALSEYRTAGAASLSPPASAAAAPTAPGRHRSARRVVISLALVGGAVLLLTILYVIMRLFPSS